MQANWPIVTEVLVLSLYSELALDIRRAIPKSSGKQWQK